MANPGRIPSSSITLGFGPSVVPGTIRSVSCVAEAAPVTGCRTSYLAIGTAPRCRCRLASSPMIETAEQAMAACVAAAKYPPDGRRSTGGVRVIADHKVLPPADQRESLVAMIGLARVSNMQRRRRRAGRRLRVHRPFDLDIARNHPENGRGNEAACSRSWPPSRRRQALVPIHALRERWARIGASRNFNRWTALSERPRI